MAVASSLSPVRRHPPTLALLGDAEELSGGRGSGLFGRGESEVIEDLLDGEAVGEEGDDLHSLAAPRADERIYQAFAFGYGYIKR